MDGLLHLLGGEAPREPVCGGEPLALQLAHQLLLRFDLITRKSILKGEYIRFVQTADLVLQAVTKVNAFKEGSWKKYMEQVNAAKLDPFGK